MQRTKLLNQPTLFPFIIIKIPPPKLSLLASLHIESALNPQGVDKQKHDNMAMKQLSTVAVWSQHLSIS